MVPMIKDHTAEPMDAKTAAAIGAVNERFYAQAAESFAATRERPWPGWQSLITTMNAVVHPNEKLLDVACGTLRFERFLAASCCSQSFDVTAIDQSVELLSVAKPWTPPASMTLHTSIADILTPKTRPIATAAYDSVVCFGLFHHIPGGPARSDLLRWLIANARPSGVIALSLWRFERNDDYVARILPLQDAAVSDTGIPLTDPHDWWLPWQRTPGLWRYCHSFTDDEIAALVDEISGKAVLLDQFDGPGSSDRFNTYLLFQVLDGS